MKTKISSWIVAVVLLFSLTACSIQSTAPAQFGAAPWQDGEVSTYDVVNSDGTLIGTAEWSVQQEADTWKIDHRMKVYDEASSGSVTLDSSLKPLHSIKQTAENTVEAVYTNTEVQVTTTTQEGETTLKTIQLDENNWDNDQLLMLHRALPLAVGYAASYTDFIPSSGLQMEAKISISEQVKITVPAGEIDTYHLVMDFSTVNHDAWYSTEAPYLMVQYRNQSSGVEFRLRSWQISKGQPVQGNLSEAGSDSEEAISFEMPPINVLNLCVMLLVQYPLMIVLPILLGWWLKKHYEQPWKLFFTGGVIFLMSQVVHIPLNWGIGLIGTGRGAALLPLPLMALVAGLSAGVCEEVARWVALRFFLKDKRGWKAAMQLGAGHGGTEAIILGLLAAWSLLNIILVQSVGVEALGLSGSSAAETISAVKAYWDSAWYLPVISGMERVFAMTCHLFMTILVMRSFTRKNMVYLFAAIGFHTLIDAWAVWGSQTFSTVWVEVGLGVLSIFALWMIFHLKDRTEEGNQS